MQEALIIFHIILSVILVVLILIQPRGTGFARSWKGSGSSFTRRGLEKLIFKATFGVAALFIAVSILRLTV